MREIKARAWHCEANEYLDGSIASMFFWLEEGQPVVIELFTGLTDKNGIEIYEGDILRHWKQGDRVVQYPMSDRYAGFGLISSSGMKNVLSDSRNLYEVVGNIHQNPELIKGE